MGINTAAPRVQLDINGALDVGTYGGITSTPVSWGSIGLSLAENGYFGVLFGQTTSNPDLMYDGSGNGGIYYPNWGWLYYTTVSNHFTGFGTTSPQQNLSVNGYINVDQGSADVGGTGGGVYHGVSFGSGSGEAIGSNRSAGSNQYGLDFYTGWNKWMSITNGGNVGIGTTAPAAKLEIDGTSGATLKIVDGNQAAGNVLTSNAAGVASWSPPGSILVYGNNAKSVALSVMQKTQNWNVYSAIPGMSITMTTLHNVIYVFASLTCRLDVGSGVTAQAGQAMVELELVVDGTVVAWTGATITDYDDHNGTVTTGTASFAGFPVTIAPGVHTILLEWEPVKLWGN